MPLDYNLYLLSSPDYAPSRMQLESTQLDSPIVRLSQKNIQ
ncbi:hypothetical protein XNA1_2830005 [Xenorhabdus nematophila str. Anatoliense]|nr:hypothetical protein XNA1_2830005 [Xenorhabdus nematophila str. Anatoliense]